MPRADEVILVTGFGRCGSSLVMQMLERGGVPVTGRFPYFEDERAGGLGWDTAWVAEQGGRAIKCLDVHRPECPLPPSVRYRTVFLERDVTQQARSHRKFMEQVMGFRMSRMDMRRWRASLIRDTPVALRKLRAVGPLLHLRFEHLIQDPRGSAAKLGEFVGVDGAVMSLAVLDRKTDARPDMGLELWLMRERAAKMLELEQADA